METIRDYKVALKNAATVEEVKAITRRLNGLGYFITNGQICDRYGIVSESAVIVDQSERVFNTLFGLKDK